MSVKMFVKFLSQPGQSKELGLTVGNSLRLVKMFHLRSFSSSKRVPDF